METGLFLLALLTPLLYAATNHIDNILLEKHFKEGGVGTLVLFSALLSVLALPVLLFIDSSVLDVSALHMAFLFGVGLLNMLLLWCYLQAMFTDEPTVVIIYYQMVPVLGLIMGYVFLGETLETRELSAMGLIVLGALFLTVYMDGGRIVFRLRTFGYMLAASLCWAAESTFFKVVALEENWVRSFFWEHVALVFIGVVIFLTIPHYRESFMKALRLNSGPILRLNVFNEGAYMTANAIAAYVVVQALVATTLLLNSFQPMFVLIIGIMLTVVFPKLEVEHVSWSHMWQKLMAMILTVYGGYLLGF